MTILVPRLHVHSCRRTNAQAISTFVIRTGVFIATPPVKRANEPTMVHRTPARKPRLKVGIAGDEWPKPLPEAPAVPLAIAPTPLVLTPSAANLKTCIATKTIRNNTTSGVGWAWQPPTVGGFHFQINGGPSVGWPTATITTPPGGQATLVATVDCKPQTVSYAVLVKDSFGGQYTFVTTLQ